MKSSFLWYLLLIVILALAFIAYLQPSFILEYGQSMLC